MTKQIVYVQQNSESIGFLALLTILFIALKLTGYIAWSWWWVLAPLWIPVGLVLGFYGIVMLVALACLIIAAVLGRWVK